MNKAKLVRSGQSQVVQLPDEFAFEGEEVNIRREGNRVILEPARKDWAWLDNVVGYLDEDFVEAALERQDVQERPALKYFK
jgi:antitoxin VapB